MGEKPSPLGEDFSLSMVMKQYTLPLIPSRQGRGDLKTPSPLAGEGRGEGYNVLLESRYQREPKAIAFRR